MNKLQEQKLRKKIRQIIKEETTTLTESMDSFYNSRVKYTDSRSKQQMVGDVVRFDGGMLRLDVGGGYAAEVHNSNATIVDKNTPLTFDMEKSLIKKLTNYINTGKSFTDKKYKLSTKTGKDGYVSVLYDKDSDDPIFGINFKTGDAYIAKYLYGGAFATVPANELKSIAITNGYDVKIKS